jgi:ABC-type uncharacterized transport system YnjBCD substrate-binding protein
LLNVTASDSSTYNHQAQDNDVKLDVADLYEITLLRLLWEIVLTVLRVTKQEENALLQMFLAASHEEMLRFGMVIINSNKFPSEKSDQILASISELSINVSKVYKHKLQTPLLTPLVRAFLDEMIDRRLRDFRGPDAPP